MSASISVSNETTLVKRICSEKHYLNSVWCLHEAWQESRRTLQKWYHRRAWSAQKHQKKNNFFFTTSKKRLSSLSLLISTLKLHTRELQEFDAYKHIFFQSTVKEELFIVSLKGRGIVDCGTDAQRRCSFVYQSSFASHFPAAPSLRIYPSSEAQKVALVIVSQTRSSNGSNRGSWAAYTTDKCRSEAGKPNGMKNSPNSMQDFKLFFLSPSCLLTL